MSALDYAAVRDLTERLAAVLGPEDQTVQSMPDVSPTKWHRAHTTWFFETFVLGRFVSGYGVFDPAYAFLFNSYYQAVGPRHARTERGLLSRPGVAEISEYRRHVDKPMVELVGALGAGSARGDTTNALVELVELGLHHEQQHQELLLMDIKHVLSVNPMRPAYGTLERRLTTATAEPTRWRSHPGGVVNVGHAGGGFAFDSERPAHDVILGAFDIATTLVTCGEWLEFIDDGGYSRPELWMSDGWATATAGGWQAPLYWESEGRRWSLFTLGGLVPVQESEPVCHLSWYEADAYARWAGVRLPTEAEWETVAPEPPPGAHLDFAALHPRPAEESAGPDQWYGEVWQWTASPYTPYPGFRVAPGAVGEYNGKFMVNQQVLRGSCCATPPGHARRTYRNFFPPSARWPFAGLRLCRDAELPGSPRATPAP